MQQQIFQVDAFCDTIFSGNPAAVCPLEFWLPDSVMQNIAMENNLAETVFYVKNEDFFEIRWFTPTVEVDLCGHATLAAAFILFTKANHPGTEIIFQSPRSGKLTVQKKEDVLTLNFPADVLEEVELTTALLQCFDRVPLQVFKGKTDYMFVYANEEEIAGMKPNLFAIATIEARGIIITARGNEVDFVSRFFAPQSGVDEDPATGSAHTSLTPYWSGVLQKETLTAMQLSKRKGFLTCTKMNERVAISGKAKLYMTGEIYLNG